MWYRQRTKMDLRNVSSQTKELVTLENSYHVATMDYDLELIEQKSLEFIQKLL